ncbi:uncharacterized protein LOC115943666 [Leptonychotes weddellii]|uniref:Uncharacterized protein LOC115943666 n=1 Tax=Leptonychotes weddellii TaxID=9713 RepID=A0A7F8RH01_LEPWE|nr:uncharacterized protein LOC115943666 [Leptonychotes weddellii]
MRNSVMRLSMGTWRRRLWKLLFGIMTLENPTISLLFRKLQSSAPPSTSDWHPSSGRSAAQIDGNVDAPPPPRPKAIPESGVCNQEVARRRAAPSTPASRRPHWPIPDGPAFHPRSGDRLAPSGESGNCASRPVHVLPFARSHSGTPMHGLWLSSTRTLAHCLPPFCYHVAAAQHVLNLQPHTRFLYFRLTYSRVSFLSLIC